MKIWAIFMALIASTSPFRVRPPTSRNAWILQSSASSRENEGNEPKQNNEHRLSKSVDLSFTQVSPSKRGSSTTSTPKALWSNGKGNSSRSSINRNERDRRRPIRKVETFGDISTQPDKFYRTLSYDHLATNSLRCIETMPHFRFDKGDSFLRKWWFTSKKWDILTGPMAAIAEKYAGAADDFVPLEEMYASCEGRQARVICIGDVHGCCDEVCDLLRAVNYHPGDLVLFLGDLVAKGPKSTDVVRLAQDLGALSVRGNHDHEVVRQGVTFRRRQGKYRRQSARVAAASSHEHLQIALDFNLREFNWLAQLPYYICSVDLGTLFVHAGFQQRVKLIEQDPWVMMTMRSLLPDGRVSARCIYTQPWADHWTGPLTVYFGHDAARGLQTHEHALGLDTGCVYGGNLTAVLLPERKIVSVPAREGYKAIVDTRSHKMLTTSKVKLQRADSSGPNEVEDVRTDADKR